MLLGGIMSKETHSDTDLQQIRLRIKEKQRSYASYNLSPAQNDLLRTFFDLAQEFDSNEDFYRVCVAALFEFLGLHSRLYLFFFHQIPYFFHLPIFHSNPK